LVAPPVSQIVRLLDAPAEDFSESEEQENDLRQAQTNPRYRGN
jgi:hypothetical protein